MVVAFVGFTLFGIGLGFYATPSTDAALSNVPNDKAGAASGIYKMASSLGSAFGVAISAALFTALRSGDASLVPFLSKCSSEKPAISISDLRRDGTVVQPAHGRHRILRDRSDRARTTIRGAAGR